jgi:hypothetical protein
MARGKAKGPDDELAALFEKRVGLAMKRDGLENAGTAAQRVVDGAPDRRQAALLSDARGEQPSETVEQVDLDRRRAEVTVADVRERAAALRAVEKEVEEEVEAVIDAHPEHFLAAAVKASETTSEAITAALNATQAAVNAWMGTRAAWGRVRMSRRRRGLELGPEVPISDLGSAVNELAQAQPQPWPGGRRAAWEQRFGASEPAARLSNREAVAQFGGKAA